jgi:hypothetical protein
VTEKYTIAQFKSSQKKGPKYGNKRVEAYGARFDSQKEADRYGILLLMLRKGIISDLRRQVTFRLEVKGILVTRYRADFTYIRDGVPTIEDCKGFRTPEYKIKCRLMKAVHNIDILET